MSPKLLLVPFGLLLSGCAPRDPVWDMPCDKRPAREVLVGTGEEEFETIGAAALPIQHGSQGGQHIWMSLRLHGFGPEASLRYGIFDQASSDIVYSGPNTRHVNLNYDTEAEASEVTGLYGYLTDRFDPDTGDPLPGASGQKVVLWADAFDACSGGAVHGETKGQVQ